MDKRTWRVILFGVLVAALALPASSGASMLRKVDGQRVAFSASETYRVADSFVYIGSYSSEKDGEATNSLRFSRALITNVVFGKRFNDTNELVEIFITQWQELPGGWKFPNQGPLAESLYDFKVTRFTGLHEFLHEKGFTFSSAFYGGIMKGYVERGKAVRQFFVIALTVMPAGADKERELRRSYNNAVVLEP